MSEELAGPGTGTRGRFITVEGIEGVGKSTHLSTIRRVLEASGKQVVMTREPGGTPVGEVIRNLLLDPNGHAISEDTELLLVFAARAQHLAAVIRPALEEGSWVVSDRFTDATYAYQGGGRGMPEDRIRILEELIQKDVRPDLTLVLDLPVELALARARKRGDVDRFEQEDLAFFGRARGTYLMRCRRWPDRYALIDTSTSIEETSEHIGKALQRLLT